MAPVNEKISRFLRSNYGFISYQGNNRTLRALLTIELMEKRRNPELKRGESYLRCITSLEITKTPEARMSESGLVDSVEVSTKEHEVSTERPYERVINELGIAAEKTVCAITDEEGPEEKIRVCLDDIRKQVMEDFGIERMNPEIVRLITKG